MGNTLVKSQLEDVTTFLEQTVQTLEDYMNETTMERLMDEKSGDELYYKGLLSSIRKLLVYCEEGLEACRIVLKNQPFNKGAAERVLYRVYHKCIEEYFSPKSDLWFEDSRSAYTGRNCIKFREETPESLKTLITKLEFDVQKVREELEYYETDYQTKMVQSK